MKNTVVETLLWRAAGTLPLPVFRTWCRQWVWVGLLICMLLLTACGAEKPQAVQVLGGETMGTRYTVKYLAEPGQSLPAAALLHRQVEAALQEVNRQMSTYQADSEISRFNRLPGGEGMPISDGFATVLAEAQTLNRSTRGALDVSIGPVVNLWGFGPDKSIARAPEAAQLAAAAKAVGLDKIRLNRAQQPARLDKLADGVYLDLSAIAKGFGVDRVAQVLEENGVQHYLVEIGGELRGRGRNAQGQPWQVGIEQPQMAQGQAAQVVLPLDNRALATSGDYRNFHTDAQGRRLSHIIHPQTMAPITHQLASVSVVADSTMRADGLATGLFVLGEQEALAMAEEQDLAVFLIIHTGDGFRSEMSSAFRRLLAESQAAH